MKNLLLASFAIAFTFAAAHSASAAELSAVQAKELMLVLERHDFRNSGLGGQWRVDGQHADCSIENGGVGQIEYKCMITEPSHFQQVMFSGADALTVFSILSINGGSVESLPGRLGVKASEIRCHYRNEAYACEIL